MKVSVGVSNRHVHLTKEHLEILFGKDYTLEKVKDLNQPGQFVTNSKLTIKTAKNMIENVTVVGDLRDYTQVEISLTDAYKLGINPPIRESGNIKGSSPITLIGPKGIVDLDEGCIIANRHIHISKRQLQYYNFKEDDIVSILIGGEKPGLIGNVHFVVKEKAYFELHLDTDDANAFKLKNGDIVTIIGDNYESKNM